MNENIVSEQNSLNLNKKDVLLEFIKSDETSVNREYFQSLLDLGYDEWQKPENNKWSYSDMVQFVGEKYGELVAFAVLIGKYNQQVCNGGHIQYYDNGYASGSGAMTNHGEDISLHEKLLDLCLKNTELKIFEWYEPLKNILQRFTNFSIDEERYETCSCSECGGSGEIIDEGIEDDDWTTEGIEMTCNSCGGSGEEEIDNDNYGQVYGHDWENLDDEYYAINEQIEKDLEVYFKNKLL